MRLKAKNLTEIIFVMTIFTGALGCGIFQYPAGKQRFLFSAIYTAITTFLHYSSYIYNVFFLEPLKWSTILQKVISLFYLVHFGIAVMTQINVFLNHEMLKRMYRRIEMVDETLQELGGIINHDEQLKFTILIIIYWITAVILLNTLDAIIVPRTNSFIVCLLFVTIRNHSVHMNFMSLLCTHLTMRFVQCRFFTLNELIKNSFIFHYQQPRNSDPWSFWLYRNVQLNSNFKFTSRNLMQGDEDYKSLIQVGKHVHLELVLISRTLMKKYASTLTLQAICTFISITALLYQMTTIVRSNTNGQGLKIFWIFLWIAVPLFNLIMVCASGVSLKNEANRTGVVIGNGINNSIGDSELHDEVKQFSLQLILHRLDEDHDIGGTFQADYSFVIAFISVVMTYTIILLQTEKDDTPTARSREWVEWSGFGDESGGGSTKD